MNRQAAAVEDDCTLSYGRPNFELTPRDLRAVESASSNIRVAGARYPEWIEQMTGR
jgi:hypothetical protein